MLEGTVKTTLDEGFLRQLKLSCGFSVDNLNLMECPHCTGDLIPHSSIISDNEKLFFGTIACRCSIYPVVFGVLVLDQQLIEPLVNALLAKDVGATFTILNSTAQVPIDLMNKLPSSLNAALDIVENALPEHTEWIIQLRYWHGTPKYLAFLPLAAELARVNPKSICDLGTGVGHLTLTIQTLTNAKTFFAVDSSLISLIVSSLILSSSPNTSLIHYSGDNCFPIKTNAIEYVLNSDSFPYFHSKPTTLREINRVTIDDGGLLFTHLHNSLCKSEPSQGRSLDPMSWIDLFSKLSKDELAFFSDDQLRNKIFNALPTFYWDERLKASESLNASLVSVPSISIVSGRRIINNLKSLVNDDIFKRKISGQTLINPIFEVKDSGNHIDLKRRLPSKFYEDEMQFRERIAEFTLEKSRLADLNYLSMLRRKAIIIDVPSTLIKGSEKNLLQGYGL